MSAFLSEIFFQSTSLRKSYATRGHDSSVERIIAKIFCKCVSHGENKNTRELRF
jgi:hypothetical protein